MPKAKSAIAPDSFLEDPDPDGAEKCNFAELVFIKAFLTNGFNRPGAVAEAWPNCPVERRANYAHAVLKREHVNAVMQKLITEMLGGLKDRLEYQIIRFYMMAAFFDPFEIIDKSGKMRKGLKVADLGERAAIIQGIDPRTGKVQLFDKAEALEKLSKYIDIAQDKPQQVTVNQQNNLIILPAKQEAATWNQPAQE